METGANYPLNATRLKVRQVTFQAEGINSYELVHPDGADLPPFEAGAHIDFFFHDGSVRQYSLCNDPAERHRYLIAVLKDERGRGGSVGLHERVHVQRTVCVGAVRNNFALDETAGRHLLLAGGIGVTPMLAMIARLRTIGADFTMHYCTRSPAHTAFRPELGPLIDDGRVILHHDNGRPADGLDIAALLADRTAGTHLYYCGPKGFMRACEAAAAEWPEGTVHREFFTAEASPKLSLTAAERAAAMGGTIGIGFQVEIASTGAQFSVPNDKSIAEVLNENGIAVETSCNSGLCGTCKTRYLKGEVEHHDLILSPEEQQECLTLCCSRASGKLLVLDL
ncbi:MAG: PDR/VanB family oxidoreductase [Proteobacteria bacterium]|nr:PDR/VanB family oxidoreductase [Pseudomonadota bacterium]